ncbi:MAG TPA: pyridoxal-phosphate dependent enzyme [Vicinamibacterales bacterium]|nr:pyridoxal-phosphate dependent enzyme [Vicinamibacterales bacterium]
MIATLLQDVSSPASLVGRTPLVRLPAFEPRPGIEIYAKLESRNPGGSVKDRAALAMIREGERTGALHPGRVLLDASSGNTGISYAMLGASRGFHVRLCVPANVSPERQRLMRAYGAELILTDPMEGSDGAIREAHRLYDRDPSRYFYPDQYSNPANWRAHYDTTAVEIIEQTGGRVSHFVAGLGTSGTFVGTGRRLREWRPSVQLVSVQPESPLHGLEGLKHMASAIVPSIYDPTLADRDERVSTEESHALVRRLARRHGILVGPSGAAALAASVRIAADTADDESAVIVTVFPDGGDRYMSAPFWDQDDRTLAAPPDVLQRIRDHGAHTYPDECCGALIARRPGEVAEAFALSNTMDGERRRRFLIGPDEYRLAEARATEIGGDVIGFYHSHPDHPARPSAFDLEHAWPNLSYVIVSVRQGRAEETRSWRLRGDRSTFDEETLEAL